MEPQLITPETKQKLLKTATSMIRNSEEALLQSFRLRDKGSIDVSHQDYPIWNAYEFILLVQFDISCLLRDMVDHESKLGPNLYARLLVLTIHESTLTLRKLLSKDFQINMSGILNNDGVSTIRQLHSRVQDLFEECNSQMGAVRHGIVGHRDEDADLRLELLGKADVQEVADLTIKLLHVLAAIMPFFFSYFSGPNAQ